MSLVSNVNYSFNRKCCVVCVVGITESLGSLVNIVPNHGPDDRGSGAKGFASRLTKGRSKLPVRWALGQGSARPGPGPGRVRGWFKWQQSNAKQNISCFIGPLFFRKGEVIRSYVRLMLVTQSASRNNSDTDLIFLGDFRSCRISERVHD
jgi:hypothetical protein